MFKSLQEIYSGKKVFITGHTGFKGAWLLKILHMLGANVKGYSLEPKTKDDLFNLISGDKICQSEIGDLRDKQKLADSINSFKPDFVFHLAAQPLVRLSYDIPAETFEVNVIGTANVLEAVRLLESECHVILITTDKVYYNNEWLYPYRENDRLGGYDPYSASKACAELLIDSYRNSFFNVSEFESHKKTISVARAGNVIGGGDWSKDRLLPDIARSLGNKEDVIIRNPRSLRPWQHVLEPLLGYLLLGKNVSKDHKLFSGAFNFGPASEDAISVEAIVKFSINNWGSGSYSIIDSSKQPHEAGLLKLDISKSINALGWKPQFTAEEAVKQTILWYKTFQENQSGIADFTRKQINNFISNA